MHRWLKTASHTLAVVFSLGFSMWGQPSNSKEKIEFVQEAREICDIAIPWTGRVRMRGTGRIAGDGLLLGDITCPLRTRTGEVQRSVIVDIKAFVDRNRHREFNEWLDSIERPVIQTVLVGELDCRVVERPSHPRLGTGYGRTGSIPCRMKNAIVEKIARFH